MNEEHRVEILTGCVILLNMGMSGQVSQSKFEVGHICIMVFVYSFESNGLGEIGVGKLWF